MKTGICICMKRSGVTFAICCKAWFKAEASLSLTLPCASVWKRSGCSLSLSCGLRLETGSCFVLAKGTLSCWWRWRQRKLQSKTGLLHSQCCLVLMPAKWEAQPENTNPDNRQEILSYCGSVWGFFPLLCFFFSPPFFFVVSRFRFVVVFVPAVLPLCLGQVSCQHFHLEIPTCRVHSMIVHSPHLCFASKVSTWTWIHLTKSDATRVVAKLDPHSSQVWLLYCK